MIRIVEILKRHKETLNQIVKYGLGAVIGLAIDFAIVVITVEVFGLYYLLGVCLGFIVGLIVTFEISNRYVFGQPKTSKKSLFIFFGVIGLIGLLILNALVWFFTEIAEINYIVSKVIATAFVFLWNFFARKRLYD